MAKIVTPHAAVIVFNLVDRAGYNTLDAVRANDTEDKIILTKSLLSIETNKSKSDPAGRFELILAPTKNWLAAISTGSWVAILISQDPITTKDFNNVDPRKLKMIGRIETVRSMMTADPNTGARHTNYIISGQDWGGIFNSILYLDTATRDPAGGNIATANTILYSEILKDQIDANNGVKSQDNINVVKKLFGSTISTASALESKTELVAQSEYRYKLPIKMMSYLGFREQLIANIIDVVGGKLVGKGQYDNYQGYNDGFSIISPSDLNGARSFWQIILDSANGMLNENFTELRWINNKPSLSLYNRIRPFCLHDSKNIFKDRSFLGDGAGAYGSGQIASKFISKFINLPHVEIPLEHVISCNAGNNWRDKVNFIEFRYTNANSMSTLNAQTRIDSQFSDKVSIGRDGFRPHFMSTKYVLVDDKTQRDIADAVQFKYLGKEWFFNAHNMLNGTLYMVGVSSYIAVGDNILVDTRVLSPNNNINSATLPSKKSVKRSFMLAHVEDIAHKVEIDANGSITYRTSINFVRGIIVDKNGKQLTLSGSGIYGALDQLTTTLPASKEFISNVITDSTNDPDRKKYIDNSDYVQDSLDAQDKVDTFGRNT